MAKWKVLVLSMPRNTLRRVCQTIYLLGCCSWAVVGSALADEPILIEDAAARDRFVAESILSEELLVVAFQGDDWIDPVAPARILVFSVGQAATKRSEREFVLDAISIGGVAMLGRNLIAVGLPNAASVGDQSDDGLQVRDGGTAEWAQPRVVKEAGRVELLQIGRDSIRHVGSLSSPHPVHLGRFGDALAADEGVLAVGEPGSEPSRVHLYERDGSGDFDLRFAQSFEGTAGFGRTLAMSEQLLVVGAPQHYCCGGSVFVFDLSGETPRQLDSLTNSDGSLRVLFGETVKAFGSGVVVGGGGVDVADGIVGPGGLYVHLGRRGILNPGTQLGAGPVSNANGYGLPSNVAAGGGAIVIRHREGLTIFRHEGQRWVVTGRSPYGGNQRRTHISTDGRHIVLTTWIVLESSESDGRDVLGWMVHVHDAP